LPLLWPVRCIHVHNVLACTVRFNTLISFSHIPVLVQKYPLLQSPLCPLIIFLLSARGFATLEVHLAVSTTILIITHAILFAALTRRLSLIEVLLSSAIFPQRLTDVNTSSHSAKLQTRLRLEPDTPLCIEPLHIKHSLCQFVHTRLSVKWLFRLFVRLHTYVAAEWLLLLSAVLEVSSTNLDPKSGYFVEWFSWIHSSSKISLDTASNQATTT
jgi:hypothetical protein